MSSGSSPEIRWINLNRHSAAERRSCDIPVPEGRFIHAVQVLRPTNHVCHASEWRCFEQYQAAINLTFRCRLKPVDVGSGVIARIISE